MPLDPEAITTKGNEMTIDEMVTRFLNWPLPESVRADQCATEQGRKGRVGTNLLTAHEARQMLEYVLNGSTAAPPEPLRFPGIDAEPEVVHSCGYYYVVANHDDHGAAGPYCRTEAEAVAAWDAFVKRVREACGAKGGAS